MENKEKYSFYKQKLKKQTQSLLIISIIILIINIHFVTMNFTSCIEYVFLFYSMGYQIIKIYNNRNNNFYLNYDYKYYKSDCSNFSQKREF